MKFYVSMQLSFRNTVSDYTLVEAEDTDDARQKGYECLHGKIPKNATDIKVDYVYMARYQVVSSAD